MPRIFIGRMDGQSDVALVDNAVDLQDGEPGVIPKDRNELQSLSPRGYQKEMLEASLKVRQHGR